MSADTFTLDAEGVLQFNDANDVRLNGPGRVTLSILQRYRLVNEGDDAPNPRRPWKVHTTGWIYTLKTKEGSLIVDYHWHPQRTPDVGFPHLHPAEPLVGRHYPTGRVLIEDVLQLARECGATPKNEEGWIRVYRTNVKNFVKGATWGTGRGPGFTQ